jgi:hypothetical protein
VTEPGAAGETGPGRAGTGTGEPASPLTQLDRLAQHTIESANRLGRPDLAELVATRRSPIEQRSQRVVVCGRFKAGKSTLVNALVGRRISPTDPVVPTRVPLSIFGGEETAGVYVDRGQGPVFEVVDTADVADLLLGRNPAELEDGRLLGVVARTEHPLLERGFVLVDTPPVAGGLRTAAALTVLAELQRASSFLFLVDADQELSRPDLDFIDAGLKICPNMACCVTKIDRQPRWREVGARNQHLLQAIGCQTPVLPLSTRLFHQAARYRDTELRPRSGLPLLRSYLTEGLAQSDAWILAGAINLAATQLKASVKTEVAAGRDQGNLDELRLAAEQASTRAARMNDPSSSWQTVFRRALRQLDDARRTHLKAALTDTRRAALAWVEDDDPSDIWPTIESDLQAEVSRLVSAHLEFIRQQGRVVIATVAESLEDDAADLGISVGNYRRSAASVNIELEDRSFGGGLQAAQSGILASRVGGPIGLMVFGLLAGPLGPPLAVTAGIGAALSSSSVFLVGGRRSSRQQRQRQAELAVRAYLDEATIALERISNDATNWVMDQLTDGFDGAATQLQAAADEQRRAYEGAQQGAADDPQRLQQLLREAKEIEIIRVLSGQVLAGRR